MQVNKGKIHIASLEFFVTDNCNLRCKQCTSSSPYLAWPNKPDPDLFKSILIDLSRVMHSRQIKILGGEPLLNKELCLFIKAARESEMFDKIRITTNGILLSKMSDEFWKLADIIEVSWYPLADKAPSKDTLHLLKQKADRFNTSFEINTKVRFSQEISDVRIESHELIQEIYDRCYEAHYWPCHLLYRNRLYICSRVHTLDRYLTVLGIEHENFIEKDGIVIDGRENLFQDLYNYFRSPTPLEACAFCLGTSGIQKRHQQLTTQDIRNKKAGKDLEPFNENLLAFRRSRFSNLAHFIWQWTLIFPRYPTKSHLLKRIVQRIYWR